MNKPTLWVMVGLSGSGKSSVAKEIAEENPNTVIVSSNNIREELTGDYGNQKNNEEVFKVFHKRIREALENNTNVIADATNITMRSRRAIIENVKGIECRKIAYLIPKPFDQCKIDNLNRQHPVPNEVLDKQIRKFQIPFMKERFNEGIIHYIHNKNRLDALKMFDNMEGFNQQNQHHTSTLADHCKNAHELFSKYGYPSKYNLAALFHDYGKLYCKELDNDGVARFYGHDSIGSYMILENFAEIFYKDVADMCFLINYHMMPFDWTTEKSKERWKKRFGEYKYQMLLDFHECDKAR